MVPIAVEPHNTQYINSLLSVFELFQSWHFKTLDLALYRLCCINRKEATDWPIYYNCWRLYTDVWFKYDQARGIDIRTYYHIKNKY